MRIEFDPAKEQLNMEKHGVSLTLAGLLDWQTAVIAQDKRVGYFERYDEVRYRAFGMIGTVVYFVAFTPRMDGDNKPVMRSISMRRAFRNEARNYEYARKNHARVQPGK